ncbi:LuxR family transcriptional regulator [Labilithrix luteola]|uniref:LuxR family transcriptional regulator n=1 Tax=Labilithrix luteola TaxID=1391654 RepID=A0A0K1QE83_9BACT|nr:GIY-YIG nuclease family protein [Labilithrix luteola]AKV04038.1 LuxR family transcriptional regulator [Labilithrix luteola]
MTSRSELKRQFKETPKRAGVFTITNTKNGKVFLGSSLNLHGPLEKHRFMLKLGGHFVGELQRDWQRFGPDAFAFAIVEEVTPKNDEDFRMETALAELEARWVEKVSPFGEGGYNVDRNIRE